MQLQLHPASKMERKSLSLLKLVNINKIYQLASQQIHVLKNINFNVDAGEMLAIMGASGSGKSTLVNLLGLLDSPSSGEYFIRDCNVANLHKNELARIRNQQIGFVFQSFFLLPRSNAINNVMLPLLYQGYSDKEAREKSKEMLEKLNVGHLALHLPKQLSGGQQQRVAIARALVTNPDIILADEPTGALDSKTGQDIMNVFQKLHQDEKRTIIIITHDHAISSLCERTILLKDGQIIN